MLRISIYLAFLALLLTLLNCVELGAPFVIFADGFPPDGTPMIVVQGPHKALVVVYYTLAVCGIIGSIMFLVFNFIYRNTKYVNLLTYPC